MFMGEYHHNIDDKNRLVIPSSFRDMLKSEFIITRGLEKCLYIYTQEEWQRIVDKLNTLPFTKKDARIFTRSFFSAACKCLIDNQGRVSISSPQAEYAELIKECVIIGASDRIEVWSSDNWNRFNLEYADMLSDIAENLFSED